MLAWPLSSQIPSKNIVCSEIDPRFGSYLFAALFPDPDWKYPRGRRSAPASFFSLRREEIGPTLRHGCKACPRLSIHRRMGRPKRPLCVAVGGKIDPRGPVCEKTCNLTRLPSYSDTWWLFSITMKGKVAWAWIRVKNDLKSEVDERPPGRAHRSSRGRPARRVDRLPLARTVNENAAVGLGFAPDGGNAMALGLAAVWARARPVISPPKCSTEEATLAKVPVSPSPRSTNTLNQLDRIFRPCCGRVSVDGTKTYFDTKRHRRTITIISKTTTSWFGYTRTRIWCCRTIAGKLPGRLTRISPHIDTWWWAACGKRKR